MLILTRRPHEKILIGDDIEVIILSAYQKDGLVRIGIDAPKEIDIVREELIKDVQEGDDPYAYMTEPETNPSSKQEK